MCRIRAHLCDSSLGEDVEDDDCDDAESTDSATEQEDVDTDVEDVEDDPVLADDNRRERSLATTKVFVASDGALPLPLVARAFVAGTALATAFRRALPPFVLVVLLLVVEGGESPVNL